jgi:hypothetical protein
MRQENELAFLAALPWLQVTVYGSPYSAPNFAERTPKFAFFALFAIHSAIAEHLSPLSI